MILNFKGASLNLFTLAAAIAAIFFLTGTSRNRQMKKEFGIVIDGGSTGTRIHVFEYLMERGMPVVEFGKGGSATSLKVSPGLSDFTDDPDSAGNSIMELIHFGKERVPKKLWDKTEIRLMATAGLRRLAVTVRERILESCRRVLRSSGFQFRDNWASVIPGSDEGVYAWVAANYAVGSLGGDPLQTTGIIELGGASAQVTFISSEPLPSDFLHTLKFGEVTYRLYSHSLLQFGQNVAYELLHKLIISGDLKFAVQEGIFLDPCTPRGYAHDVESLMLPNGALGLKNAFLPTIQAQGNFSECRSAALMLLQIGKDECKYKYCHIGSTFIPELQGNFLATENFFHISKFFGLAPTAFLSDLILAGQQFCEEDWSKLKKKYQTLDHEDLLQYCFSSAYIVALLHDSLGIAFDDKRVKVANQINGIPLDWALGAFILQKTHDLGVWHWEITTILGDYSLLFLLLVVSIILVFAVWFMSRWWKPQLKTTFDLGKGQYITTLISRWFPSYGT